MGRFPCAPWAKDERLKPPRPLRWQFLLLFVGLLVPTLLFVGVRWLVAGSEAAILLPTLTRRPATGRCRP